MRIVSKFKDYYDGVQKMGMDQSIIYIRDTQIVVNKHSKIGGDTYNLAAIGFCGKIYPCIYTERRNDGGWWDRVSNYKILFSQTTFYNKEEFLKDLDKQKEKWCDTRRVNFWLETWEKMGIDHFDDYKTRDKNFLSKSFQQYNCPIFIFEETKEFTVLNPMLKPWDFQKIMDPWTAFQELSMFVEGVLKGHSNPVPEVSDEDMIIAKGFDKWSFRKESKKNEK